MFAGLSNNHISAESATSQRHTCESLHTSHSLDYYPFTYGSGGGDTGETVYDNTRLSITTSA